MLISPNVCKNIGKAAAKEGTRYALNGVLLERKADSCHAVATDGRMLLRFAWADDDWTEFPPVDGMSIEPKEGFSTLIGAKELADVAKMAPRRVARDILKRIALDEQSADGSVTFSATDLCNTQTRGVIPVEGHFPKYEDVIPRYRLGYDAIEIGVTPELLSRLLAAMAGAATSCDNKPVKMTVPIHPSKPIVLESRNNEEGVEATGVIMPVSVGEDRAEATPIRHSERLAAELGRLVRVLQSMLETVRETPKTQAETVLQADHVVRALDSATEALELAGCPLNPPVDEMVPTTEPITSGPGDELAEAA